MLPVIPVRGRHKSIGFQQFNTLSTAVSLAPKGSGTIMALVQAETRSVRWRDDGTAPTANTGMLLPVNTPYEFRGDLDAVKFIETEASASLTVTYYGQEIV